MFDTKAVLSYVILDANLLSRVSRSSSCHGNCGVLYQNRGQARLRVGACEVVKVVTKGEVNIVNKPIQVTTDVLIKAILQRDFCNKKPCLCKGKKQ